VTVRPSSARPILFLAVVISTIAACATVPPPPAASAPSASPSAPEATATAPSADEVFERVAPSVAFVGTDVGTGSGLVLDERHVLTNAHVVRPYRAARLVFADKTEIAEARVVGWDLEADLAVLDTGRSIDATDLPTSDTDARTGERVYLVGYPLANVATPSGTITEGIISGAAFEWIDDLTFHQTDAVIDDGQSGGVLVDGSGALLGITGGSRGRFAIALDGDDALARAARLLDGEDVDGTGDHLLPSPRSDGETDIDVVIRHRADVRVWLVPGGAGDPPVTVTLSSDRPVGLYGMAAAGWLGHGAGPPNRVLKLSIPFEATGPYAVKIEPIDSRRATVSLRSSVGLTAFEDTDDGRSIAVGGSEVGAADYAGDIDWYRLELAKGRHVTVRASSASGDPALFIDRPGDDPVPLANGHDDGGPLGIDDVVEFDPPADGEYLVIVSDARFQGSGAYRLTVEED
jgi:hypothetical protein